MSQSARGSMPTVVQPHKAIARVLLQDTVTQTQSARQCAQIAPPLPILVRRQLAHTERLDHVPQPVPHRPLLRTLHHEILETAQSCGGTGVLTYSWDRGPVEGAPRSRAIRGGGGRRGRPGVAPRARATRTGTEQNCTKIPNQTAYLSHSRPVGCQGSHFSGLCDTISPITSPSIVTASRARLSARSCSRSSAASPGSSAATGSWFVTSIFVVAFP